MADADLLSTFNFEVTLRPSGRGGDEALARRAGFSEVSGLEIGIESIAFQEGGYNVGQRRLVGKTTNPELVLKRGLTADAGFWQWIQACFDGTFPLPYVGGTIAVYPPG